MSPQSFIFIGRAGAGKGTQAKLLSEALQKIHDRPVLYVETGSELRKFCASNDTYTKQQTKKIIDQGLLMPEFMPVYMWAKLLAEQYTGQEHVIFDGTPRKLLEAKLLESVFPFYSLNKPYVIYLDIEHQHSSQRISLRAKSGGRNDDQPDIIEHRRIAFEQDVTPTVEWYRSNPNVIFLDIDGRPSIEEVHAQIVKAVGLS